MSRARATVAVLGGAGRMGRATVWELARLGHRVRLARHRRARRARKVARRYGGGRATVAAVENAEPDALASALRGAGARGQLRALPPEPRRPCSAALHAGCHYLDLGGLFHTTREAAAAAIASSGCLPPGRPRDGQRARGRQRAGPRRRGPAPRVRAIRVYNGGADFTRYRAPLAFGFAPATLLDELTLPPMVFTGGRFRAAAPLSGAEEIDFEIGAQTVHLSLHSEVATLPLTYRDKGISECSFKIAYDPVARSSGSSCWPTSA